MLKIWQEALVTDERSEPSAHLPREGEAGRGRCLDGYSATFIHGCVGYEAMSFYSS